MKRSPGQNLLFLLSIVIALVPIAFGLLRAYSVRTDLRYLWVAIASYAGVAAAMTIGKVIAAPMIRFMVAFVIATLAGWSVAMLTGAKSVPAFMVAIFFGFCGAGGAALFRLSHSGTHDG